MEIRPQVSQAVLTAAGQATSPVRSRNGVLFLQIAGAFTGAVFRLGYSPDDGKTYTLLTVDKDGNSLDITAAMAGPLYVGPEGVLWIVQCTAMSSGSALLTVMS